MRLGAETVGMGYALVCMVEGSILQTWGYWPNCITTPMCISTLQ